MNIFIQTLLNLSPLAKEKTEGFLFNRVMIFIVISFLKNQL